jgi:hypothetical protein
MPTTPGTAPVPPRWARARLLPNGVEREDRPSYGFDPLSHRCHNQAATCPHSLQREAALHSDGRRSVLGTSGDSRRRGTGKGVIDRGRVDMHLTSGGIVWSRCDPSSRRFRVSAVWPGTNLRWAVGGWCAWRGCEGRPQSMAVAGAGVGDQSLDREGREMARNSRKFFACFVSFREFRDPNASHGAEHRPVWPVGYVGGGPTLILTRTHEWGQALQGAVCP